MTNYKQLLLLVFGVSFLSGCIDTEGGSNRPWTYGQVFDRVVIIVLENTNHSDAHQDPYLHSLEARGALLSDYHAVVHPSYPNYLAMVSGKLFPTLLDTQINIDDSSVADLLEAKNLTWKNYAEDYPGNCFLGSTSGNYARKHVPFLSFKSIQNNPARCAQVVPATEFNVDWKTKSLPNYSFYSPNLINDGHDTSLNVASQWLQNFLEPLLADSEAMKKTLIAITFDEAADYLSDNHIYTVLVGPMVIPGSIDSTKYSHYSLLKTIESNFGLGTLGKEDEEVGPIVGDAPIWQ